jgi:multisubunit Na+/H+ antiporter MnhC subunit
MKTLMLILLFCLLFQTSYSQAENNNNFLNNQKSESKALSYSLLSTVGTILPGVLIARRNGEINTTSGILLASGYLFGSGAGHIYAKNSKRFWVGTGIRSSAVLLFVIGLANADISIGPTSSSSSNGNDGVAAIGVFGGMALGLYGIIRDFATVDNSVREYNDNLHSASYSIAPSLYTQNDNLTLGLQFKLTL